MCGKTRLSNEGIEGRENENERIIEVLGNKKSIIIFLEKALRNIIQILWFVIFDMGILIYSTICKGILHVF